jgi:hypothetical protein
VSWNRYQDQPYAAEQQIWRTVDGLTSVSELRLKPRISAERFTLDRTVLDFSSVTPKVSIGDAQSAIPDVQLSGPGNLVDALTGYLDAVGSSTPRARLNAIASLYAAQYVPLAMRAAILLVLADLSEVAVSHAATTDGNGRAGVTFTLTTGDQGHEEVLMTVDRVTGELFAVEYRDRGELNQYQLFRSVTWTDVLGSVTPAPTVRSTVERDGVRA